MQSVTLCGFTDRNWIEPCRLNQDVLCLFCDHRIETAHHTGESNRAIAVGNDQVVG